MTPLTPDEEKELTDNLYVLHFKGQSFEEFSAFIGKLHNNINPHLPGRLQWRLPSESEIRALYEGMQAKYERIQSLAERAGQ